MNPLKALAIVCCLILACGVLLPAARADEWNQKTEMFFNQPIEIPGLALPAGTYWFVLSNDWDQNLVQIYSEDWSTIYASLLTIPTVRPNSTARTEIQFAERPHQSPEALLRWYYPGRLWGHEFVYPQKVEMRLSRDVKHDLLIRHANLSQATSPGA